MKLPQLKHGKWNYLAISFAIPALGFLMVMILGGCVPFGEYALLYSDMYHQYFPFFKAFREALRSGDSLLYNWNVGMGLDYLGLISYYLASPLNLLSVFLPDSWVLPYFSLLSPVKLGFAGLFFAIFLKKMFGRDDLSLPLFGSFYALCAWALGYQWNIMWLDTFALLPLVVLGTVSLLRDKKYVLYTVTLFLSVFANYYVGLFTCIFVFLVFACYQICRCRSVRRFFEDLLRIALFSALAIGMTAVLELPALAALQTTYSSINTFPSEFELNIVAYEAVADARTAWTIYASAKAAGESAVALWFSAVGKSILPILQGMRQIASNMGGGIEPSFMDGLPNLYTGVGTMFFAFLFLTARQVKLRDKICTVALLVFFMLSFLIRQLDYMWHGFHFTNMMPYRFSFLFSFVMLYMAYRAYLLWRRFRLWQVLCAGGLVLGVLLLRENPSPTYLIYNGLFFLLYTLIHVSYHYAKPMPKERGSEENRIRCRGIRYRRRCAERKNRRELSTIALALVLGTELILNVVNFGICFPKILMGDYPRGTRYTESMIRYMKEREDELFYRAEVTHAQTLNDGALNSYHGISAFTSSANVKVTEFTRALGLSSQDGYNRYCYEEGSPVTNLFLGLKYMLERDGDVEENPYFDTVHSYKGVYLQENNAYLPLGFLAEPALENVTFHSGGSFLFQNFLFTAATGILKDVWHTRDIANLKITSSGIHLSEVSSFGYCKYEAAAGAGILKYTYEIQNSGFLCLDMDMPMGNAFSVWLNGRELYQELLTLPQIMSVSQVSPGDVVEIHIECKQGEDSNMTIEAGLLDDGVFRQGYEILNASTLELTYFSNTKIEGDISCNRDGLLYTSIPQDGNWIVVLDGERVETTTVGDAMVAVPLTEGEHTLLFLYENRAYKIGGAISVACFLVFGGLVWRGYISKRKQGKYAK